MKKSLITSDAGLAECQTKIDHVLNVLLRPVFNKLDFSAQQWQVVVENGGQFQDQTVELVKKLVKKDSGSGIITPLRAQDTGLVPDGWTVKSDNLEGDINLANLDYSSCLVRKDEDYVNGDTMLDRAGNAYGSLGFAAALLKAQDEGKEIFPVESRGKHYFVMPRTVLLDDDRRREVAGFHWHGKLWALHFYWLDDRFHDYARFVRPRE